MESAPRALDVMSWSRLPDRARQEGSTRPKMVTITMMMRFIMMMVIDMMVIMAIGMV